MSVVALIRQGDQYIQVSGNKLSFKKNKTEREVFFPHVLFFGAGGWGAGGWG